MNSREPFRPDLPFLFSDPFTTALQVTVFQSQLHCCWIFGLLSQIMDPGRSALTIYVTSRTLSF